MHGGRIRVDSTPGTGSTFRCSSPAAPSITRRRHEARQKNLTSLTNLLQCRILLPCASVRHDRSNDCQASEPIHGPVGRSIGGIFERASVSHFHHLEYALGFWACPTGGERIRIPSVPR